MLAVISGQTKIYGLIAVSYTHLDVYKRQNDALAIFITPPSVEELEKRLKKRSTETEEKINTRIAKAKKEMEFAGQFDVIIVNDVLSTALADAEKAVAGFLSEN